MKLNQISLKTYFLCILIFTFWFVPFVPALLGPTIVVNQPTLEFPVRYKSVGYIQEDWVSWENIPSYVWQTLVVSEDARFFEHSGFDLIEIFASINKNIQKKAYIRGGSTISQQLVKMAFLTREKSIIRKLREFCGTLILEAMFSKNEILTWYLNLVEFGNGIYGLKQASWQYFRVKPKNLRLDQAIHLILVLPNPKKWSIGLKNKNLTHFGHKRFARIALQLQQNGFISQGQRLKLLEYGNFGQFIH